MPTNTSLMAVSMEQPRGRAWRPRLKSPAGAGWGRYGGDDRYAGSSAGQGTRPLLRHYRGCCELCRRPQDERPCHPPGGCPCCAEGSDGGVRNILERVVEFDGD